MKTQEEKEREERRQTRTRSETFDGYLRMKNGGIINVQRGRKGREKENLN